MSERLLYLAARGLVRLLQCLPMDAVARLGRVGGQVAYWLDRSHRRVALANLRACFPNVYSQKQARALAREHFRRLGENYSCAIKAAALSWAELQSRCEIVGMERLLAHAQGSQRPNIIVAIGHFGNFELYARLGNMAPGWRTATTYRSLHPPSLNRLLQTLRSKSGCLYFERRTESGALRAAMSSTPIILGLLADQHAGRSGIRVPLFDRLCSTTVAPAVLAQRYHAALHTCVCYRTGLARWRFVAGEEIPTRAAGKRRSVEAITRDINLAFEAAIRQDPANWFWVHDRWKTPRRRPQ